MAADAWFAAADRRINRDPLNQLLVSHCGKVYAETFLPSQSPPPCHAGGREFELVGPSES
jgi:hypothetical protein